MGMLPRLNSWTCVVHVPRSSPIFPLIYTWGPFHNVYSRDSLLPNISTSTIQPIHQMLPHGHDNKAHLLNKHDEFLNQQGLFGVAVLQCALVATLDVLNLLIAGILPFINISTSTIQPSHMGMLPRLSSWTSIVSFWTSVMYLRCSPPMCPLIYTQSCLVYSLSMNSPPPNVLPFTNQPICQTLSSGHANWTSVWYLWWSPTMCPQIYTHSSFVYSSSIKSLLPNFYHRPIRPSNEHYHMARPPLLISWSVGYLWLSFSLTSLTGPLQNKCCVSVKAWSGKNE